MAVRTVSLDCNSVTYTYNTFTAKKGLSVLRRLVKILGPSFSALVSGADGDEVESMSLESAMMSLVAQLDSDEIETLIIDMTNEVIRDNMTIDFNTEFASNYKALLDLLISITKENYNNLFTGSGFIGLPL